MKFIDVENTVKQYMLLEDKGIVRLICASMMANYLPTPPAWMFIVGNSSGGKSMLLSALKTVEGIFELDDMTAASFASGMKGQSQNSLLYLLPTNGTVLIKDYTTMLSKDKESRGQILGQMRKIFDGDYRKKFGNGEEVNWQGKMGMLAGVTPEIYSSEVTITNAALGERYLYYQMEMPDRIEVGMVSTEDIRDYEANRAMTEAFGTYLNTHILRCKQEQEEERFVMPALSEEIRREIVYLAEFATRARSGVKRNMYSRDKDQEMPPTLEMTPRFAKALNCIAYGLLMIHRYDGEKEELSEQDKSILFKIALDSIPLSRRVILEALTMYSNATESGMVENLGLSKAFIQMFLADLVALGLVTISKGYGHGWLYELKPIYREIMAKYKHLDMGTKSLEAEGPDDAPLPTEGPPPTPEEIQSLTQAGLL